MLFINIFLSPDRLFPKPCIVNSAIINTFSFQIIPSVWIIFICILLHVSTFSIFMWLVFLWFYFISFISSVRLPWCLSDKKSACQCRDTRVVGWIPGLRRSPGEENGNPLQYSCLGNPLDSRAWRATVYGVAKKSDRLSNYTAKNNPLNRLMVKFCKVLDGINPTHHCYSYCYFSSSFFFLNIHF